LTLDDIETPAVVIDRDRVERNLQKAQAYADEHGLKLRPHIKTHKLPHLATRQVELGACGITCQKLGEAEVMADAGLSDILLTFNIVGPAKLKRLKALAQRVTLAVTADSAHTIDGYAETFGADAPLTIFVECDTGMGRCGVPSIDEALALAKRIDGAQSLRFGGLMTFPAAGKPEEAATWLTEACGKLKEAGLDVPVVTSGGTPDMWRAHEAGVVTEYRPGTYIYMDRSQVAREACTFDECALHVLATVVSAPAPDRVVLDSGSKTLSSDTLGLEGFGYIPAYPEARITSLSEEHGVVDVSACKRRPAIGDRIAIIPNHACVVTNLFDEVHFVGGNGPVERVPVAARGRVD
jgi:D-serine deaminase-like pyridoxal phosphate-dependent protein